MKNIAYLVNVNTEEFDDRDALQMLQQARGQSSALFAGAFTIRTGQNYTVTTIKQSGDGTARNYASIEEVYEHLRTTIPGLTSGFIGVIFHDPSIQPSVEQIVRDLEYEPVIKRFTGYLDTR